jgi:uncharacterized protein with ParB-like and HNH nuclease domain
MDNNAENKNLKYKTIEEVFQVKYYIDFYQRDYTWGWDNVNALLEDVYYRFDLKYSVDSDATPDFIKANFKWYYLNTYIVSNQEGKTCIVDGQQRFSSLTLILIKLYHLAIRKELSDTRTDTIKQLICKSSTKGLEFWMGGNDRSATLEDLFKKQTNSKPDRKLNPSEENLFERYSQISTYLDDKFNPFDSHYLECFIIYFLTMIKLVEIPIKESDDVAMVFEVINAKGQKLKSHEILKAQLLSQIPKGELEEYLTLWHEACANLRHTGLTYPNIDDPIDAFFTYFFKARYSKAITEVLTFKDYHKTIFSRDWQERLPFKKRVAFVKTFIKTDFIYYADLMKRLVASTIETNKYVYYNVKLNDLSNLYLLILSAIKPNDQLCDEKIVLISKLLDRHYTLLRLQGCYDSNAFNKQLMSLVLKLRDKNDLDEIKKEFDEQLLADINKTKNSTVTEVITYTFFKNTKLSGNNKNFIRYFLARIENFLCSEMNHTSFAGYSVLVTGKKYHIEHVLAQNEENKKAFGNEDHFEEQRNRIGGLLLLKKGDNEMSLDEVYPEKLKTYVNDTLLARTLTSNFYHNNSGHKEFASQFPEIQFKAIPKFDELALEERQKLIFNISKTIWGDKYLMEN